MLRLEELWIWDSWVADDGDLYHLYFLQAPRSLGDPTHRHVHARVGHATSRDLVTWDYWGECFGPAESGFDDLAIWTGSVLRANGQWWMFYSALSAQWPDRMEQRVGSAVSDDLHSWRRVGDQPLLQVDPRWYGTLGGAPGASDAWRDPLVLPDPDGDGWHMLITARAVHAAPYDDGIVAHATSRDLRTWEVRPPRCRPGAGFGQLEVVQSKVIEGRAVLVFTCHPRETAAWRVRSSGRYCTWSVPGAGVLGPWDVRRARPFTADRDLFAAPLVRRRDGSWVIMGFRNLEHQGRDGLFIHDPIPVTLDDEGYLRAV